MLSFEEKIDIFKTYLEEVKTGYGNEMKDEIYFCFFENEWNFNFLNKLATKEEIVNKIELVVSKMILHEHEDELENIMLYQFYE
jgi:hypothetical protein